MPGSLDNIKNEKVSDTNLYKYLGHFFFIVYISYCGYYYIERTLPFDGAFYSFKMIHESWFNIENGRWGAFYTQIIPIIGLKCGASLKTFLFLFSISFGICNYIFYLIIQYYFKYTYVALAFILSLLIGYKHSFFYPVSEIHSTVPVLFLILATLKKYSEKTLPINQMIWLIICTLLILWIAKTHIISIIPLTFILCYQLIDDGPFRNVKKTITISTISILIFGIILSFIPENSYESSKMISLESIKSVFISLSNHYGFDFFKGEFSRNYYLPTAIALVCFSYLIYARLFLKAASLFVSLIGFWIIIMAYTRYPDGPYNYQNYYCYWGIFIAIPFCTDIIAKFNSKTIIVVLTIIIFHGYYKISKAGLRFTDRKEYVLRTTRNLHKLHGHKFLISETNFFQDMVWSWWNFSFESLLLSSLDGPNNSLSFYSSNSEKEYLERGVSDKNTFIGVSFAPYWFAVSDINKTARYFHLNESVYKKVNSLQDGSFCDTIFNNKNIKINLDNNYNLLRSEHRVITIEVENLTDSLFKSVITENKKIRLSYRLKDEFGNIVVEEGYRSPLEMDILPHSKIETGLVIALFNVSRGTYEIEVDLVHENMRWFKINRKSIVTIY